MNTSTLCVPKRVLNTFCVLSVTESFSVTWEVSHLADAETKHVNDWLSSVHHKGCRAVIFSWVCLISDCYILLVFSKASKCRLTQLCLGQAPKTNWVFALTRVLKIPLNEVGS